MKNVILFTVFVIFILSSINLSAQDSFIEDGISYFQVTNVRQLAELSCDVNRSVSNWEELPEALQNLLSGRMTEAIAGCYGKRNWRKICKNGGGLCVTSSVTLDDQTGEILRMIGGMVNEYGEYDDPPVEGRLFYGVDVDGEVVITFRN